MSATRCPECGGPAPRGNTQEFLLWAKRVGRREALREAVEAVKGLELGYREQFAVISAIDKLDLRDACK